MLNFCEKANFEQNIILGDKNQSCGFDPEDYEYCALKGVKKIKLKKQEWTKKIYTFLSGCFDRILIPAIHWRFFYNNIYVISTNHTNSQDNLAQKNLDDESKYYKGLRDEFDDLLIKLLYLGVDDKCCNVII